MQGMQKDGDTLLIVEQRVEQRDEVTTFRLSTMFLATAAWRALKGSVVPFSSATLVDGAAEDAAASGAGAGAEALACAGAAVGDGAAVVLAPLPPFLKPSTSDAVILPDGPLPDRLLRSTPSSFASFLAYGVAMTRPSARF